MEGNVFFIGEARVDLCRSVVTLNGQDISLEPKVLKVLALLARHPGQVVRHDTIMADVWPGVEVVPNALQRCIAQLRKALGDSAREQRIIVTHPKIGYSLKAEVRFLSPAAQTDASDMPLPGKKRFVRKRKVAWATLLVAILLLWLLGSFNRTVMVFNEIHQLTQSDENELNPVYSRDGEYLVFNRHTDLCTSHLWARELAGGREFQLTKTEGVYGNASFSPDGNELAFAVMKTCPEGNGETNIWSVATLDFANALQGPTEPTFRLIGSQELIEAAKALGNGRYAFLRFRDGRYNLMQLDGRSGELRELYATLSDRLYYYDYDPRHTRFALVSRSPEGNDRLVLLTLDGKEISAKDITRPKGMSRYQYFEPDFTPNGEHLLVTTQHGPYALSLRGELTPVEAPEQGLFDLALHPIEHRLAAVRGQVDSDIAELRLADDQLPDSLPGFNGLPQPYPSIARSTAMEISPSYQPEGDAIAFISNRSGEDQIWLWQNGTARQLTTARSGEPIGGFAWSPDGKHIAYLLHDQLTLVDLTGQMRTLKSDIPLRAVQHWYDAGHLLVSADTDKIRRLYEFNIKTGRLSALPLSNVTRAWRYGERLIYSDKQDISWLWNPMLPEKKSRRLNADSQQCLIATADSLYCVDIQTRILIRTGIETGQQTNIARLKDKAWQVSDLRGDTLLLTQYIAAKKELVELR